MLQTHQSDNAKIRPNIDGQNKVRKSSEDLQILTLTKDKGNLRLSKTQITNPLGFGWMESRKCGDEQTMYYTTGWEPFSRQISLAFSNHPFCPPATMLCSNHRHFHLERELVIAHFEN